MKKRLTKTFWLTDEQIEILKPLFKELGEYNEKSNDEKPGTIIAQIYSDGVHAGLLTYEEARQAAHIVGNFSGGTSRTLEERKIEAAIANKVKSCN